MVAPSQGHNYVVDPATGETIDQEIPQPFTTPQWMLDLLAQGHIPTNLPTDLAGSMSLADYQNSEPALNALMYQLDPTGMMYSAIRWGVGDPERTYYAKTGEQILQGLMNDPNYHGRLDATYINSLIPPYQGTPTAHTGQGYNDYVDKTYGSLIQQMGLQNGPVSPGSTPAPGAAGAGAGWQWRTGPSAPPPPPAPAANPAPAGNPYASGTTAGSNPYASGATAAPPGTGALPYQRTQTGDRPPLLGGGSGGQAQPAWGQARRPFGGAVGGAITTGARAGGLRPLRPFGSR